MPLLLHENIEPEGEIGVWKTTESMEFFMRSMPLFEEEIAQIKHLSHRKKLEWLSSRFLLHHMSGRETRGACYKDEYGKPHLSGSRYQISLSHSRDLTAVIAAPHRVGIDIQHRVEKINRIASRFMSEEELSRSGNPPDIDILHYHWGAKECIFKAYGRKSVDFRRDIKVLTFVPTEKDFSFYAEFQKEGISSHYHLTKKIIDHAILVYAIEKKY
jgi:4'-phosphopantetheinyl transferase